MTLLTKGGGAELHACLFYITQNVFCVLQQAVRSTDFSACRIDKGLFRVWIRRESRPSTAAVVPLSSLFRVLCNGVSLFKIASLWPKRFQLCFGRTC
jgi:hypothetical protein